MNYRPDEIVKSCPKLESGLRLGIEGVHACQLGPFSSPLFWTADEASKIRITKAMIVEKRKQLYEQLNAEHGDIACRNCMMVIKKRYEDVIFTRLGRIDHAPTTVCNLRCSFCGNTARNAFAESKYDALAILREFSPEDVEWDSIVDFNGGEPTLLPDFDEHLDYFVSRRIRILLYSNAVIFRQSVYDALAKGTLFWLCSSLDCGTPSTFFQLKKRDHFLTVLENLTRYAHAGCQGGGMLAVKYIFCENNCGDDDISGFVYAMLAIRPQKIWLTFDFTPFGNLSPNWEGPDYSNQIAAYVKMYNLLKKHGLAATHYSEGHLARICQQGKNLLNKVLSEINRSIIPHEQALLLKDARRKEDLLPLPSPNFQTAPLRIAMPNRVSEPWSLEGTRILMAPSCPRSVSLLTDTDIRKGNIIGFLDRDPVLQGKFIEGIPVFPYEAIADLNPDVVLVAAPEQHRGEIVNQISKRTKPAAIIASLD